MHMCHVLTYYICIWIGRVCIYYVCIEVVCVYIFAQYMDCCMYTYTIQNTHTHTRTHAHTHSHTHTHIGSANTHQSKWILICSQMLLRPPTNIQIKFTTYTGDGGAYFIGGRYGKHKCAPRVSPGKSWEGIFAELACTCATGMYEFCVFFLAIKQTGVLSTFIIYKSCNIYVCDFV